MQEAPHPVSPVSHASRYNTLHFASKVVCQWGQAPFGNPHKKRRYAPLLHGGAYRLFLLSSPPAVSVEQKSAWDWCGIFNFEIPRAPTWTRPGGSRPGATPAPPGTIPLLCAAASAVRQSPGSWTTPFHAMRWFIISDYRVQGQQFYFPRE